MNIATANPRPAYQYDYFLVFRPQNQRKKITLKSVPHQLEATAYKVSDKGAASQPDVESALVMPAEPFDQADTDPVKKETDYTNDYNHGRKRVVFQSISGIVDGIA